MNHGLAILAEPAASVSRRFISNDFVREKSKVVSV
jgi:hypothetical protein